MKLSVLNASLLPRVAVLVLLALLAGCKSDNEAAPASGTLSPLPETVLLTQVAITDYIVVSTRRVGRTVMEYTLRAVATNNSATRYTNVTATLLDVPAHISIVEGGAAFGTLAANGETTSADEFTITVDLSIKTSLDDLVWRVEGTVPGTGGGGTGGPPSSVGIFMSFDNNEQIRGESTSDSHRGWIELLSFTEGSSRANRSVGGGGSAGRVNLEDVTVTKYLDQSSPALRLALARGDIFTEVRIDVVKSCGGSLYTEYAITLTVALLTGLTMDSSSGDERPTESLSLNYSRIETMYTPVGPGCRLESPIFSFQDAIPL